MRPTVRRGGLLVLMLSIHLLSACADEAVETTPEGFLAGLSLVSAPEGVVGDDDAFGSIAGLVLLGTGELVVSDGMNGRLKRYVGGSHVGSFGRLGEGPDEFTGLGAIARTRGDTLIAVDSRRGRLVVFESPEDSLIRLHDVDLPFPATGVCTAAGRVFVLGRHDGMLVHETTVNGGVLNSFGEVQGSDPFEIAFNSLAEIACSAEPDVIAVVSRVLDRVRIFSGSGASILEDSIPSFIAPSYERGPNFIRPMPPPLGYANVVAAAHWFGGDLLIQLRTNPGDEDGLLESRWLSNDGTWSDRLPRWPKILAHTADGLVYAAVEDPYPVVRIYRVW